MNYSKIYKTISLAILSIGLILGCCLAFVFKVPVEGSYYTSSDGNVNYLLMLYIWSGTLFVFAIFWGIFCILQNQEAIIVKMDGKDNTAEAAKEQIENETRTD